VSLWIRGLFMVGIVNQRISGRISGAAMLEINGLDIVKFHSGFLGRVELHNTPENKKP
jgi:hypothetical protein